MASLFDLEGLGKDQAELLDLLDSVQLAGIGDDILPQIVVVGDQSSGKSSVLTRLTGIEFPRSQYACTKFATEIRLRRSSGYPDDRIRAWILPDKSVPGSDEKRQALEAFNRDLEETPESIAKCMQEASDLIAPKQDANINTSRPIFSSKDKLIIQKIGPQLPALTLVDLPGLVKNKNEKQTPEDIKLINELSDMYMKDKASIILAVVSGAQQYSQAPVLQKVGEWDPEGARTMGLLTKPDVADREYYTDEFLRLMMQRDANKDYHFQLGWHVLLNPDAFSNPTMQERDQREAQYWLGRKWAKLPDYMRGADALRVRLSRQLQKEIGRQLPAIQERIQLWEENCEAALAKLGRVLASEKDKAKELGRLFSLSHQLTQQAVYGHLVNPPKMHFFPDDYDPRGIPAQHLRAKAVAESEAFEAEFRQLGLRCRFVDEKGKVNVKAKHEFAKKIVEPLLPQIRGRELPGDPNTRAPYMVFRRYSKQWHQLAKTYERKIEAACTAFLEELKESAWPPRMRAPLEKNHLTARFGELLTDARSELDQINQETFSLEIQPFDREYNKCIAESLTTTEDGKLLSDAEKVTEQMLAYYMLAERIFIRNVIYQVAERHLLAGMMRLFDTSEVMGMDDETIDKITVEDPDAQNHRRALEQEKERIEDARMKCDAVAARTSSRLHTETSPIDGFDDDDDNVYTGVHTNGNARSEDGDSGNNDEQHQENEKKREEREMARRAEEMKQFEKRKREDEARIEKERREREIREREELEEENRRTMAEKARQDFLQRQRELEAKQRLEEERMKAEQELEAQRRLDEERMKLALEREAQRRLEERLKREELERQGEAKRKLEEELKKEEQERETQRKAEEERVRKQFEQEQATQKRLEALRRKKEMEDNRLKSALRDPESSQTTSRQAAPTSSILMSSPITQDFDVDQPAYSPPISPPLNHHQQQQDQPLSFGTAFPPHLGQQPFFNPTPPTPQLTAATIAMQQGYRNRVMPGDFPTEEDEVAPTATQRNRSGGSHPVTSGTRRTPGPVQPGPYLLQTSRQGSLDHDDYGDDGSSSSSRRKKGSGIGKIFNSFR